MNRLPGYLEHTPHLEAAVAFASGRLALDADEREELRQEVELKLLEDDSAVLRRYQGKATFKTFLSTVVLNVARDYRIRKWGRFRPSARALREGPTAVKLETLTARDGWEISEAIEHLVRTERVRHSRVELEEMAVRVRCTPRRPTPKAAELDEFAGGGVEAVEDRVERRERRRLALRVEEEMGRALEDMPAEDRLLLKLFYVKGLTVPQVAHTLAVEPKPLYGRLDRLRQGLRRSLEARGLQWTQVRELVGDPERELRFDFDLSPDPAQAAVSSLGAQATQSQEVNNEKGESDATSSSSSRLSEGAGEG